MRRWGATGMTWSWAALTAAQVACGSVTGAPDPASTGSGPAGGTGGSSSGTAATISSSSAGVGGGGAGGAGGAGACSWAHAHGGPSVDSVSAIAVDGASDLLLVGS